MLSLIGATVGAVSSRLIIDIAMYFGVFVIVAMGLNFQYGNAGVPNMGSAVQVIAGGFAVSTFILRLNLWIVERAGKTILPYASDYDWVYNNPANIRVVNDFITNRPLFGISMLLFSLSMSLVLGAAIGWVISLPAIRLRATYLMITLITMADASQIIARNWVPLCGGTLGVFVPNVFAWYPGDRTIITAVVTLAIGLVSFFIFRTMLNSPYGRLMRSIRENEVTVGSVGKNVPGIRRNILVFASAITALTGALWSFYCSFVKDTLFQRATWTYWPWLMLILGGPGNNAGTFLGCALVIAMRRIIIVYKWFFDKILFFPTSYFEQILLGTLLIVVMIFRPSGLIPEKLLYIPGINYGQLVREEVKVDWRTATKARTGGGRFKLWRRKEGGS
jgi:branched-chain amino acid transport system permease protein